ncbi:MAG: PEP-CTERM sorting domain-containing protein [Symploca sp. SIO2B6]|nr:PEP-CTERM sorting domain-containing protein [Symploca sp. SIO2B6]
MSFINRSPILSGCVAFSIGLWALPAEAITLATSKGEFSFENFSHPVTFGDVSIDTSSFISPSTPKPQGGIVETEGDVFFDTALGKGANVLFSEIFLPQPTTASTDGVASLLGNFAIGANDVFSFNFFGGVSVNTSVDQPSKEAATAFSGAGFLLFDITDAANPILLDSLGLFGRTSTADNNDILDFAFDSPSNISISNSSFDRQFGGWVESANASVSGMYQRTFSSDTIVSLQEIKNTGADSSAIPEPTTSLLIGGLLSTGVWLKKRRANR